MEQRKRPTHSLKFIHKAKEKIIFKHKLDLTKYKEFLLGGDNDIEFKGTYVIHHPTEGKKDTPVIFETKYSNITVKLKNN